MSRCKRKPSHPLTPFGLSLSKPGRAGSRPFDKLRANEWGVCRIALRANGSGVCGTALDANGWGARRIAPTPARRGARGIALPAMVFMVVMVGLMLSAGLLLITQSQHSQSLQLQTARALAAAKSGTEWGLWKVSDPTGALALAGDTLPPCFGAQALTLPSPLDGLTVQVSCTREPAAGTVDEGGLRLASYRLLAVAGSGNPGAPDYVQRQLEARHTVCKNPGASAPLYAC